MQKALCGLVGDLLELVVGQLQAPEGCHLLHGVPQRVVRAVGHALGAVTTKEPPIRRVRIGIYTVLNESVSP